MKSAKGIASEESNINNIIAGNDEEDGADEDEIKAKKEKEKNTKRKRRSC